MSLFIVGCNDECSIIMADSRATVGKIDDKFLLDEIRRKLYFIGNEIKWVGAYGTTLGYDLYRKIKTNKVENIDDVEILFNKCYDDKLTSLDYSKEEIDNSMAFIVWITVENDIQKARLGLLSKELSGILQLNNSTVTFYPPDVKSPDGNWYDHENFSGELSLYELLINYVEKFILISNDSKYVSDKCCIGITFQNSDMYYIEENMNDLLSKLKDGKQIENKIEFLIQYQQDYDSDKIWNYLFGL